MKTCAAKGDGWSCDRVHFARGFCNGHYLQLLRGRPQTPLRGYRTSRHRDEQGRKLCRRCQAWKPESEFHSEPKAADGLFGHCAECARRNGLARYYGLTLEEYESMLAAQGGLCAVCGASKSRGKRPQLHVDHCHSTGTVRGILCRSCNLALGYVRDDPQVLRAMIDYLEATS